MKEIKRKPYEEPIWIVFALLAAGIGLLVWHKSGFSGFGHVAEAREALEKLVDGESNGQIKLTDFHELSAGPARIYGPNDYVVSFEAKLLIGSTGTWLCGAEHTHFGFTARPATSFNFFGSVVNGPIGVHEGQVINIEGTLLGEKVNDEWVFSLTEERIASSL
jgi:hypothetical protein